MNFYFQVLDLGCRVDGDRDSSMSLETPDLISRFSVSTLCDSPSLPCVISFYVSTPHNCFSVSPPRNLFLLNYSASSSSSSSAPIVLEVAAHAASAGVRNLW
ncbi:hypothetical protein TIFTF001_026059 [Ficus carica]|uniref:Uncharacterized protein n=1 Tax=Ficus carica TaxID=3494 RepID=A0AA88B1S5_FICCA|nr:hypothetical protein TIFTF001_026059 [Ficus carica]